MGLAAVCEGGGYGRWMREVEGGEVFGPLGGWKEELVVWMDGWMLLESTGLWNYVLFLERKGRTKKDRKKKEKRKEKKDKPTRTSTPLINNSKILSLETLEAAPLGIGHASTISLVHKFKN